MIRSNSINSLNFIDYIDHYNQGNSNKNKNSVLKLCNAILANMRIIESCISSHIYREKFSTFSTRILKNFSRNKEVVKTANQIKTYINSFFFDFEDVVNHILSFLFSKQVSKFNRSTGLEAIALTNKSLNYYSQEYKKALVKKNFLKLKTLYNLTTADNSIECIENFNFKKVNLKCIDNINYQHLKKISELNVTSLQILFECECPMMPSLEELICIGYIDDKCLENITEACPNLTSLDLSLKLNLVTDIGISKLKNLRKLSKFKLNSPFITDLGANELKNLSKLTKIDFLNMSLTFKSLIKIAKANRNLESLSFFTNYFNDKGLSKLTKKFSNLSSLNFLKTKVTQRGLLKLAKNCNILEFLSFESTSDMTDDELVELAKKFLSLKKIGLFNIPHITINGILNFMEASPNLKTILTDNREILKQKMFFKIAYPNIDVLLRFSS